MTINTNELIGMLARAPRPQPLHLGVAALAMVCVGWVLTVLILGLRPDLADVPLSFLQKTGVLALSAVLACLALQRDAKPLAQEKPKAAMLVVALAFAAWLVWEWGNFDVHDIAASFFMPNFRFCLGFTTVYGLAAMAGLVCAARNYAPADGKKAATAIGLCASFIAGLGYSIHCPIDSPTFILVAYGLPAIVITLLARKTLPRFLSW